MSFADAVPNVQLSGRDAHIVTGNGSRDRILFTVVALICLFSLAFTTGYRIQRYKPRLKFAQILVYTQTILCICFVVSSAVITVGLGFTAQQHCYAAIIVCLLFFSSSKMALYIFLLERVHLVRAPFMSGRLSDRIWVYGMLFIVIVFGGICIGNYVTARSTISPHDGRCRIGSSVITAYITLAFDAFVNACLTAIFALLLRPVALLRQGSTTSLTNDDQATKNYQLKRPIAKVAWFGLKGREHRSKLYWENVRVVLRKHVIGSALIFAAGAANLIAFYVDVAAQLGFLCLMLCLVDVTFGVLVVHWLTIGSTTTDTREPAPSQWCSTSSVSTNEVI